MLAYYNETPVPFPLDAPTPPGYVVGAGRGAVPVGGRSGDNGPRATKRGREAITSVRDLPGVPAVDIDNDDVRDIQGILNGDGTSATATATAVVQSEDEKVRNLTQQQIHSQCAEIKADVTADDWLTMPDFVATTAKRSKKSGVSNAAAAMYASDAVGDGGSKTKSLFSRASAANNPDDTEDPNNNNSNLAMVDALQFAQDDDAGRADKKRLLNFYKNAVVLEPTKAQNWVHLATLHDALGNQPAARRVLREASEKVPHDESVWLELLRLSVAEKKREVAAAACAACPTSLELWSQHASVMEHLERECARLGDVQQQNFFMAERRRVLLQGLEHNPASTMLWKEVIQGADVAARRALLRKALRSVSDEEMFLALAVIEGPDDGRKVLALAKKRLPKSLPVMLASAALDAGRSNCGCGDAVRNIFQQLDTDTECESTLRDTWLQCHAAACEDEHKKDRVPGSAGAAMKYLAVAAAIVDIVVAADSKELDEVTKATPDDAAAIDVVSTKLKRAWVDDGEALLSTGHVECARLLYTAVCRVLPRSKGLLVRRGTLELLHPRDDSVSVLQEGIDRRPDCPKLWVLLARHHRDHGDRDGERTTLETALCPERHPGVEELWLSLAVLTEDTARASGTDVVVSQVSDVFERSLAACPSSHRLYMKYAVFVRRWRGSSDDAVARILERGVKAPLRSETEVDAKRQKPNDSVAAVAPDRCLHKLWLMTLQRMIAVQKASSVNDESDADKKVRLAANRAILMSALKASGGKCPQVWLLASEVEESLHGDIVKARTLLDKARTVLPKCPDVYIASIRFEARNKNRPVAKKYVGLGVQAVQSDPRQAGRVHAAGIETEPIGTRRPLIRAALQACPRHIDVLLEAAGYFLAMGEHHEAVQAAADAVASSDGTNGDAWVAWYVCAQTARASAAVLEKIEHDALEKGRAGLIRTGEAWLSVVKSPECCAIRGCVLSPEDVLRRVVDAMKGGKLCARIVS
eukprot:PhM_4_TR14147/c0_g1_i3/m.104306/K12855/PRPF6, PRP6; pre-mRNA-processing factor 6